MHAAEANQKQATRRFSHPGHRLTRRGYLPPIRSHPLLVSRSLGASPGIGFRRGHPRAASRERTGSRRAGFTRNAPRAGLIIVLFAPPLPCSRSSLPLATPETPIQIITTSSSARAPGAPCPRDVRRAC